MSEQKRGLGWPTTLRGRLAFFYGCVLAAVVVGFSVTVWLLVAGEEEREQLLCPQVGPNLSAQRLILALVAGSPVAIAIAVGGGMLVTRRALASLDGVVATAGVVGVDDLGQRLRSQPGEAAEVSQLIQALNGMLDRLERSVATMRRFTADASHELRTPLAILMGEIEVTLRRRRDEPEMRTTLEGALEELGRMSALVDALLTLARSDAGELPIRRDRLDLSEVVKKVVEPFEAVGTSRDLTLTFIEGEAIAVVSDPMWVGRVVANLVDNACKFTPPGGRIEVRVEAVGPRARVVVRDTGPGVDPSLRERMFERFHRASADRGTVEGFGLGLALAQEIAHALGGEVRLDGAEGGGTTAVFELPREFIQT